VSLDTNGRVIPTWLVHLCSEQLVRLCTIYPFVYNISPFVSNVSHLCITRLTCMSHLYTNSFMCAEIVYSFMTNQFVRNSSTYAQLTYPFVFVVCAQFVHFCIIRPRVGAACAFVHGSSTCALHTPFMHSSSICTRFVHLCRIRPIFAEFVSFCTTCPMCAWFFHLCAELAQKRRVNVVTSCRTQGTGNSTSST
jgi:hypothetical protein